VALSLQKSKEATTACDALRAAGQWNTTFDPFYKLDPVWTDQFMETGTDLYKSGVLAPRDVGLLCTAVDASYTHMYAPGACR